MTPTGSLPTWKSLRAFEYDLRTVTPPCGIGAEICVMLSVPRINPSRTFTLAMIVMVGAV